jgi:hypothetical protein
MRHSIVLLVAFFLGVACTPKEQTKDQNLSVSWSAKPSPLMVGPTQFDIKVSYEDGKLFEEDQFEVEANMSHPGMVPVLGIAKKIENGLYQVNLTTTMAGSWILFLKIKLFSGTVIEKEFTFDVSR